MTAGASRRRYAMAALCVTALIAAGGLTLAALPAAATVAFDSGECQFQAVLSLGPPNLPSPSQQAAPLVNESFSFYSQPNPSCKSVNGTTISWSGGGVAQSASCYELVDLVTSSMTMIGDGQAFNGPAVGAGNLLTQEWVMQSTDQSGFLFTASGTFRPDPTIYPSPQTPTQQCLAGGFNTLYLSGVVAFEYRTTLVPLPSGVLSRRPKRLRRRSSSSRRARPGRARGPAPPPASSPPGARAPAAPRPRQARSQSASSGPSHRCT